jgi:UDP-3-O-[3-hydroxymyristoyl] glucosamine N-acyltransferase
VKITELAAICAAQLQGDSCLDIQAAAEIMRAKAGDVTLLVDKRYLAYLTTTKASACIINMDFDLNLIPADLTVLRCHDPELSFIKAVQILHPEPQIKPGIAAQAVISPTAQIAATATIGPYAIIGDDSIIGEYSIIFAGAYIGNQVKIGSHCRVYPYAVLYDRCILGEQVIIHSGAVIGADGFGYKYRQQEHIKVPQVGSVQLGDRVEVGANTCIDRGTLGATNIGQGSKIDNLVQIGHNNQVGKNVIICGHTGVSGSCDIGDAAILAGAVGIADHVNIGTQAVIMARAGVISDIPANTQVSGFPAKERKIAWKEQAALSKLPELIKQVRQLASQLNQLKKK